MAQHRECRKVYSFGPGARLGLLIVGAVLVAAGVSGVAYAYEALHGLGAQFAGICLSLVPIALALFGVPAFWQCRLELYDDHLEYYGLLVSRVIRKADVQSALRPTPRFGMFSVILKLYGQPFKSVRIAILGRMDDAFSGWMTEAAGHDA